VTGRGASTGSTSPLLPIGAYEPRESHKVVHMNPEDAARAHLDLNARVSLGHHFGTFGGPYMGYRPILEPPVHLQQACRMHRVPRGSFVAPVHGETIVLHGGGDSGGDDTAEQAAISGPDASAASETDM
jgi:hypothetical protein